jgi:hypothetical protein
MENERYFKNYFFLIQQEKEIEFLDIEAPNENEAMHALPYLSNFNWGKVTFLGDNHVIISQL